MTPTARPPRDFTLTPPRPPPISQFERVIRIIKQSKLSGHAIIAYLQKKGFPQAAAHC